MRFNHPAKFGIVAFCLILCNVIASNNCYGQATYLPLNRDLNGFFDAELNRNDFTAHSAIRPYLYAEVNEVIDIDSVFYRARSLYSYVELDSGKYGIVFPARHRKEYNGSADMWDSRNIRIVAGPLLSVNGGYDVASSKTISGSSLGAIITAGFGKKLAVSGSWQTGNSAFLPYVDAAISTSEVVPGRGYAHCSKEGYFYSNYAGYISYSPDEIFNFQLGQGKNFFGNGYRSLLLSDNTNNYPYLKISTKIWKLKYVNLYTIMNDVHGSGGIPTRFTRKYATFHYLSWNITKGISIGLFESIVWQGKDSSGTRGYDVNYLNPIIFYRPVEFAQGSSDNALIGLNLSIRFLKNQQLYGQLILDEFLLRELRAQSGWWANKHGFQLGLKSYNLFKVKGLSLQTEFNYVRPFTYSHGLYSQNYSHFNQALAHPLGANFYESVSFLKYQQGSFLVEGKFSYALKGKDSNGSNWGGDIFLDYQTVRSREFENEIAQGDQNHISYIDLRFAYILLPELNLRLEAGISNRLLRAQGITTQVNFIYLGLSTSLSNVYHDF
ncbi:MAG TPA: hypothetical protein EYN69_11595 [Flavobacteriales bacterium]|nr:hypothetical protein [Flavobacteriales bacterium]